MPTEGPGAALLCPGGCSPVESFPSLSRHNSHHQQIFLHHAGEPRELAGRSPGSSPRL